MRKFLIGVCFLGVGLAVVGARAADDVEKLAKDKLCFTCHSVEKKIVGPSYKDVAKKYKGQADAVAKLAGKVKNGGSGVWGQVPMPPNKVTDEEAKKLVTWVLSH